MQIESLTTTDNQKMGISESTKLFCAIWTHTTNIYLDTYKDCSVTGGMAPEFA